MGRFLDDADGAAAVEYVVVLGLIIVALLGVASLGQGLLTLWQHNEDKLGPSLGSR